MSLLRKIVSTICSGRAEQMAEEVIGAMPTAACLTAEPASADQPAALDVESSKGPRRYYVKPKPASADELAANDNRKQEAQRRYFVKTGRYYDPAEKAPEPRPTRATEAEEILEGGPIGLKAIFPKLSLR